MRYEKWRQGRKVPHNVYVEEFPAAMFRHEYQAEMCVTAVNFYQLQAKVDEWVVHTFGAECLRDTTERTQRFFEEACELVQAAGLPREDAIQLLNFMYDRPAGELAKEVGGVMHTLAALCTAYGVKMAESATTELARNWERADAIREKRKTKPNIGEAKGGCPHCGHWHPPDGDCV